MMLHEPLIVMYIVAMVILFSLGVSEYFTLKEKSGARKMLFFWAWPVFLIVYVIRNSKETYHWIKQFLKDAIKG